MPIRDILVVGTVLLIPVLALFTLREQHLLHAIIGRGMLGIAAAAAYALMGAPDVAVTEALMGAMLVTLLYVVVFSSTGKFRVGYVELPPFVQTGIDGPEGFMIELLENFGNAAGVKPDFIPFDDREALKDALKEGTMDMAVGPFVRPDDDGEGYLNLPIVETMVYADGNGNWLDLLRFIERKSKSGRTREAVNSRKAFYSILVSEDAHDLMDMLTVFTGDSGGEQLRRLTDKYLGGTP